MYVAYIPVGWFFIEWQQAESLPSTKDTPRDSGWPPGENTAADRERKWRTQTAC